MKRLTLLSLIVGLQTSAQPLDPSRPTFNSEVVRGTLDSGTVIAGNFRTGGRNPLNNTGLSTPGGMWSLGAYNATNAGIWVPNAGQPSATNFVMLSDGTTTHINGASEVDFDTGGAFDTLVIAATPGHGTIHPGSPFGSDQIPLGTVNGAAWSGVFAWSFYGTPAQPICTWTTGYNTAATTFTASNCPAPSAPTGTTSNLTATGTRDYIQYAGAAAGSAVAGLNGGPFTFLRPSMRHAFAANFRTDSAITSRRIWAGLFESTPATLAIAAGPAASAIDFVGVGYEAGVLSGDFACCSGDGTNYSCTDMAVAALVSTEYTVTVDWMTSGTIRCCVDAALAIRSGTPPSCVNKATNLSSTATDIGPYVANTTTNASAQNMQINSVFVR